MRRNWTIILFACQSFAWFTSSDEVTNRLTATADYGVAIAEDFTPPEQWLPGQTIKKSVGVVNTGNVDAFVRTWLEGEMDVLAEKRDKTTWDAAAGKFQDNTTTPKMAIDNTAVYNKDAGTDRDKDTITGTGFTFTKTTDDKLNSLGLTYSYQDGATTPSKVYLKELDTTIYHNPNDPTTASTNPADFNEVMTVQAGGALAYINTGAANTENLFFYKPNNSNTFKNGDDAVQQINGEKEYKVVLNSAATVDIAVDNSATIGVITVLSEDDVIKYLGESIDTDNFYPAATGLFIFRRNSDKDKASSDPTVSDYEFSGYYYVKSTSEVGIQAASTSPDKTSAENTFANQGKYFALQN